MLDTPTLIGIAGPSASGKSSLARRLTESLPGAVLLACDAYYHDASGLPPAEMARFNFDHPDAIDLPLLMDDLDRLCRGEPVFPPRYDFRTHARRRGQLCLPPTHTIVIEGLHVLHWPRLRRRLHHRFFLDLPLDDCLGRRMRRDTCERGRSRESVYAQFESAVRPMADLYVIPSRKHADRVLNGAQALDVSLRETLTHIRPHRGAVPI